MTPSAASLPQPAHSRLARALAAGYDFPVYANHRLDGDLSRIREVVFVQHGLQRNGGDDYAAGAELLKASGRKPDEVLLLTRGRRMPSQQEKTRGNRGFKSLPAGSGSEETTTGKAGASVSSGCI